MPAANKKTLPEKERGSTGRFVPCPANRWNHPGVQAAYEVQWSITKGPKRTKTNFFYQCGFCKSRVFLHNWSEGKGFTVVEAEAEGFVCVELDDKRKLELLAELGLQPMPSPPPPPAGTWAHGSQIPPSGPPVYVPIRGADMRRRTKS